VPTSTKLALPNDSELPSLPKQSIRSVPCATKQPAPIQPTLMSEDAVLGTASASPQQVGTLAAFNAQKWLLLATMPWNAPAGGAP
jgi:hypothetical protein